MILKISEALCYIQKATESKDDFNQTNFGLVEYRDGKGEMRSRYALPVISKSH